MLPVLMNNIDKLSRSALSLQDIFNCPICLDMITEPVRLTGCGHTFCKRCIKTALSSDSKKKQCPLCNCALSHRSIIDDAKTSTFLELTLELISAISIDTGVDISVHRKRVQSTHEASVDSEEFFEVRKTSSSVAHRDKKPMNDDVSKKKDDPRKSIKRKEKSSSIDFVKRNIKAVSKDTKKRKIESLETEQQSSSSTNNNCNGSEVQFVRPSTSKTLETITNKIRGNVALIDSTFEIDANNCDVDLHELTFCNGPISFTKMNEVPCNLNPKQSVSGVDKGDLGSVPFIFCGRVEGTTGIRQGANVCYISSIKLLNAIALQDLNTNGNTDGIHGENGSCRLCGRDGIFKNCEQPQFKYEPFEPAPKIKCLSLNNVATLKSLATEVVDKSGLNKPDEIDNSDVEHDIFGDIDHDTNRKTSCDNDFDDLPPSISQIPPRMDRHELKSNVDSVCNNDNNFTESQTVINVNVRSNNIKFCERDEVNMKTSNNDEKDNVNDKQDQTIVNVNEVESDVDKTSDVNNERWSKTKNVNGFTNNINEDLLNNSVIVSSSHKINKIESQNMTMVDASIIENSEPFMSRLKTQIGITGLMKTIGSANRNVAQVKHINLTQNVNLSEDIDKTDVNNANANVTIITASDNEDSEDDGVSATPPVIPENPENIFSQRILPQKNASMIITDSETNDVPSSLNDSHCFKRPLISAIAQCIPSANVEDSCRISQLPESEAVNNECDKSLVVETLSNSNIATIGEMQNMNVTCDENAVNTFTTNRRNISFVFSRLNDTQLKELKMLAFSINADITNNIIDGMTTHVVVRPDEDNKAPHTFKYLKGVASRLWVVSNVWITDCLEAKKLLPEDNYLVLDSSGEPGPARCKQLDLMPPLVRFIVVPVPPFTSTTVEQVIDLIKLCGGEIVPLEVLADKTYKFGIPRILLLDSDTDHKTIERWLQKYRLVPLNVEWLLEVVAQYQLIPINCYMIAPYPSKLLHFLSIPDEIVGDDEEFDESTKDD